MASRPPPETVLIDRRRAFFAPQFQIKLNGQPVGREVISDVIDVTYTDDEVNLDSFEFSLGDWDPAGLRPKYSSPWDESGQPAKVDGVAVPNFELGATVELRLWHQGESDPQLMLKGDVVSITPSFPAAGAPVCRVRVLNILQRLQREHLTKKLTGTKMGIAEQVAKEVGITDVKLPPDAKTGKETTDTLNNVVVYEELLKRAKEAGLVMWLEDADAGPVLHFDPPAQNDKPVASLGWGLNLVSFAPQLSTRRVVEKVEVRGGDPLKSGKDKQIVGTADWKDLPGFDRSALGPKGFDGIEKALSGTVEKIAIAEVRTAEEAKEKAIGVLKTIAGELVKATGTAIGMPELRTGRIVQITRLGPRFSGLYRLSQTTHTLGPAGYTVAFQARKLVLK